jgi:hypothetical protein
MEKTFLTKQNIRIALNTLLFHNRKTNSCEEEYDSCRNNRGVKTCYLCYSGNREHACKKFLDRYYSIKRYELISITSKLLIFYKKNPSISWIHKKDIEL